jgi:hypothetical protein
VPRVVVAWDGSEPMLDDFFHAGRGHVASYRYLWARGRGRGAGVGVGVGVDSGARGCQNRPPTWTTGVTARVPSRATPRLGKGRTAEDAGGDPTSRPAGS